MRRNYIEFVDGHRRLSGEEAWAHFNGAVKATAPADRTITTRHAELLSDTPGTLHDLNRQLRPGDST